MADIVDCLIAMAEDGVNHAGVAAQEIKRLREELEMVSRYQLDCRLCHSFEWKRGRCNSTAKCEDGELFFSTSPVLLYGA